MTAPSPGNWPVATSVCLLQSCSSAQSRPGQARPGLPSSRLLPPAFHFHYFTTRPDQTTHITSFTTSSQLAVYVLTTIPSLSLLQNTDLSLGCVSVLCDLAGAELDSNGWLPPDWTCPAATHSSPISLSHEIQKFNKNHKPRYFCR